MARFVFTAILLTVTTASEAPYIVFDVCDAHGFSQQDWVIRPHSVVKVCDDLAEGAGQPDRPTWRRWRPCFARRR